MSSTKRSLDDSSAPAPKKQKKREKKGFQVGPANLPDGTWRRKNQRIKRDLIEKAQIKKSYAKLKEREGIQPSTVRYDDNGDASTDGDIAQEGEGNGASMILPASLELHPDRQQMLDQPQQPQDQSQPPRARRERRWKPSGANGETATAGDEGVTARDDGPTKNDNRMTREDDDATGNENGDTAEEPVQEEISEDHKQHPLRKRQTKSQPFSKETREAERKKKEAEQRAKEREEANLEKERRLAERERHRKVMAKARTGGKNGQRKLGRESKVLLDKVKRLMGAT